MLDMIASQVANGVALGFIYVVIAIGLSVVLGLLGIVNFAHGAFFALGGYFALTLYQHFGWPAVALAPLGAAAVGMVLEVALIRRIYGADPLRGLIMTFAIAMFLEAAISLTWGTLSYSLPTPEFLAGFSEFGPIFITNYRAAVVLAVIALLAALWAFLTFTPYGRILRAGGRDPEMVGLLGINLPRVWTAAFGLGAGLAGVAGVLAAPIWTVMPGISQAAIMPAFVVVAIGGLGSYAGAIIAGLAVGIVTSLCVQFWPEASGAAMYVLMLLTLLLRPRGLFGIKWERFE
ncbi:branched-chain amino acid ABC transporter permease [Roseomonas chloroacetimidivorans]|uniref:branched-chain amino acid ABC transporter permease n=1 Tax=Roseomonas chloroacetimidivorans TaxID=1766656 RepID=UPI003C793408